MGRFKGRLNLLAVASGTEYSRVKCFELCRIPLLLRLFPEAQFIYIHRNPYDVFQSTAHMLDTAYWYTYFNIPKDEQILEFILRQYEILWDRYEDGRQMLLQSTNSDIKKCKQLVEVSFNDLSERPVETVKGIYDQLGWAMSSRMRSSLLEIVQDDVTKYKKNAHTEIDPKIKLIIQERWGRSFDRLGYKK